MSNYFFSRCFTDFSLSILLQRKVVRLEIPAIPCPPPPPSLMVKDGRGSRDWTFIPCYFDIPTKKEANFYITIKCC